MFNFCPSVGIVKGWDETENVLIDVVDILALFALRCSQQVSKHSSNHARGFLQRSPTHPFLPPVVSVPCSEKTDQLCCSVALRATTEAPQAPRDVCTLHKCVSTPWDHLLLEGQETVQEIPELFASGPQQNQSPEATHMKNGEGAQFVRSFWTVTKIIRDYCRFQEAKDAVSSKMRWVSETQAKYPLKILNLTWVRTRHWGPYPAYLSFIPYLVPKFTQKTQTPSHSLQQQWPQGRDKYKAGRSPANSFCYLWK